MFLFPSYVLWLSEWMVGWMNSASIHARNVLKLAKLSDEWHCHGRRLENVMSYQLKNNPAKISSWSDLKRRRTILVAIWDQFWSKNIAQSRSNIKCALRWPPISKQNYFRDGPTYRDNAHTTCSLAKHATSQPSSWSDLKRRRTIPS